MGQVIETGNPDKEREVLLNSTEGGFLQWIGIIIFSAQAALAGTRKRPKECESERGSPPRSTPVPLYRIRQVQKQNGENQKKDLSNS
ncbi:hypothetical protein OPQ81_009119 [Rhizoctonia solani]|nr:hypothetical protein OPQ81_009119 [Rhizoctonia solani]